MTIHDQLNHLIQRGLITPTSDNTYQFHHALTHDVTYSTLLNADRRHLHQKVAESILNLYPQRLTEMAPTLAHHFAAANNHQQAYHFYRQAADAAARGYANQEAYDYYAHALGHSQHLPTLTPQERTDLYLAHGRLAELTHQYPHAHQLYTDLLTFGHKHHPPAIIAATLALATLATTSTPYHDINHGQTLATQALSLAETAHDVAAQAQALSLLMILARYQTKLNLAQAYGERALTLARQHQLTQQLAITLNDLANVYTSQQKVTQGLQLLTEATTLFRQQGNIPLLIDNLGNIGFLQYYIGDYPATAHTVTDILNLSQQTNNIWGFAYAYWIQCQLLATLGQFAPAITATHQALHYSQQGGITLPQVVLPAELAALYAFLGAYDQAQNQLTQAEQIATQQAPYLLPRIYLQYAYIHLWQQDYDQLATRLQQLQDINPSLSDPVILQAEYLYHQNQLDTAHQKLTTFLENQQYPAHTRLPQLYALLSRIAWAQNQPDQAVQYITQACHLTRTNQAHRYHWLGTAQHAYICQQQGQTTAAQQLQAESKASLNYCLRHTPQQYRHSFQRQAHQWLAPYQL
ncbi:MAG TPA: hypothetical protein VLL52_12935 [Anaerolineae bacterium]|nr:hypothetical protein [Anaerolineae bacterium]